ncbi:hypothetical protein ACH43Y_32095 [Streptomyces rubiginosohelvolus]|nr:hypothetical protein [Streptomyces sp. JS01]
MGWATEEQRLVLRPAHGGRTDPASAPVLADLVQRLTAQRP